MNDFDLQPVPISKKWYAVYTVVRHEKVVDSFLKAKNVEVFLPLEIVISRWKDRKKRIELPLFPGYLFVNISLQDRWQVIATRGVVGILGANRVPTPVALDQIEAVKKLSASGLKYDPHPYLSQGKEAVVTNGPLQGTVGKVLDKRGEHRLILSVDIIRRSVAVEVDARDVEPI